MTESNLSELPSEVIRSTLRETVEKYLKTKKYEINVDSASKAGENNFIGIVYRILFSKKDESTSKTSKLILKVAPQNVARRAQFKSRELFLREIYMYNEVLPYFRKFEQSKGLIIEENGFNEYPKCYRTIEVEPAESIFLEDLNCRAFAMIDRCEGVITADHVRLVMQSLGKFHAISLALKDQQPDKFIKLTSNLKEIFIRRDDAFFRAYFNKQIENISIAVSQEEDAHLLAKVKKLFEKDALDIAADCLEFSSIDSSSVITHGDAWQNNTMFRNDIKGKPIQICLLDWQIARHASPILDIVYFLFSCTTKELRDVHYENFLKTYHESLTIHIRRLGSDPEILFSFEMMQHHFRKYARFGLVMASMLLPMITSDGGHAVDMDGLADAIQNGEEVDASVFVSEASLNRLNKRMRDVVADMARLEYI